MSPGLPCDINSQFWMWDGPQVGDIWQQPPHPLPSFPCSNQAGTRTIPWAVKMVKRVFSCLPCYFGGSLVVLLRMASLESVENKDNGSQTTHVLLFNLPMSSTFYLGPRILNNRQGQV